MKNLIYVTAFAFLSLQILCEETIAEAPVETESILEDTKNPVATDGSSDSPSPPPQLDMAQLEQMNKMMKMLTGMQCLVSMDKFLRDNSSELQKLKDKENAQTRMDRLVVNLYKTCKSNDDMDNFADLLDPNKGKDKSKEENKEGTDEEVPAKASACLLYTSPSPRDS